MTEPPSVRCFWLHGPAFVSVAVVVVFACCMLLLFRGGSRGRVQGVRIPPPLPEMTCSFPIQMVLCQKKKKLCGLLVLTVEQETRAPPPKKILDPPLLLFFFLSSRCLYSFNINSCYNELINGNLQKLWNKVLYYLFTCKAAFEIIGLNLKISVIWQNINMIKQDNPNIKYTELKDQSMMHFHELLVLIGMEEINVSFKQL